MKLQWINEFSDIGSELSNMDTLKIAKLNSHYLAYSGSSTPKESKVPTSESPGKKELKRRTSTFNSVSMKIKAHILDLTDMQDRTFNVFKACSIIGRDDFLQCSTVYCLTDLEIMPILNENQLVHFLDKVQAEYNHKVEYHNDMHGVDVMQMAHRMLT